MDLKVTGKSDQELICLAILAKVNHDFETLRTTLQSFLLGNHTKLSVNRFSFSCNYADRYISS